jgi:hypothetical protein
MQNVYSPLGALVNEILLTGAEAAGLVEPELVLPSEIWGAEGKEIGTPDPPSEAVTASPSDPAAAPRNVCVWEMILNIRCESTIFYI